MSSKSWNSKAKLTKAKPRGYIYGAKLTFPVPLPPAYEGQKPKYRLMALPVVACLVRVVVQEPEDEKHWAKGLGGTERMAVYCRLSVPELQIDEHIFLDNDDQQTLWKVTLGQGHPKHGLRQLPVERLVYDHSIRSFYRVEHVALEDKKNDDPARYRVVMGA